MDAIQVKDLGKLYYRRRDTHRSFKSFLLGKAKWKKKSFDNFWALRHVDFSVKQGETLGIIGANGAGKSTLLSLIAETTAATEGSVHVQGRISSLLELGAGFHPDLTGCENVFLNASILGMLRSDTEKHYDEIITLAGIGDAIDTPVKFYSSGMYVRLAFAVAVMCDPDILLMDEVLAVGDEVFRKNSMDRIASFRRQGKTLLIVSHDLEAIKRMSDRVLLLNEGKVVELGDTIEVIDHYRNYAVYQDGDVTVKEYGTEDVTISDVRVMVNDQPMNDQIPGGATFKISFLLKSKKPVSKPVVGFGLTDNLGNIVFGTNTQIHQIDIDAVDGEKNVTIDIPSLNLRRGVYYLSLAVHSFDHSVQYHRLDNAFKLRITSAEIIEGYLIQPCSFKVESSR